ncbi:N-acetyl-gamma-glutamyl-phosphate reductase [Allonocardiopsis opalescens]|uniref:N-acetyl-gamma-glutamyl-phosphate reductase n=1 Tax=Allonocardiopsis opalescens TaxID=1144618 RepID=A0A2T0PY79_9ACTN|nr:N-acetyl-gamma-glutamyl-phosphate reductase [Allonocardiopsis opalescens]PRX96505.1 N-acetyl-gamma-glutamyl-phosphate reductase [Allonocardiopsis opalescens]
MTTACVAGGAGYIGGELIRLLLGHPRVEFAGASSATLAGRRIDGAHPNLRGLTDASFTEPGRLPRCDVLFTAAPHTRAMAAVREHLDTGAVVIDLSGDFRLRDPGEYERYYGVPHTEPELLDGFVSGLPELHRAEIATADRISVPGCMATAAILALHPLVRSGLAVGEPRVDARTGSSGSGASAAHNTHAERSGALRVYAPLGHRHEAEIRQALGRPVRMTVTGIGAVRGVQVLCWTRLAPGAGPREVRAAYRTRYAAEPFVRVVAARRGPHRLPDPKILAGANFCDVGFAADEAGGEVLAVAALDNLVKGGAGNAVQCMNLRLGLPERSGLEFSGLHPV